MPDEGPPGIWRVIFPVPPEEEEALTLSEEMVERRMQRFLPRKERYQIKYKSIYKVHQRVAKEFRVGRVLLAGDAAHLNNPMGAFGLNGGSTIPSTSRRSSRRCAAAKPTRPCWTPTCGSAAP